MTMGVLLVNLGTPDAPTPKAVRKYLREFLSDPRVVELPRFIWWIILYGFILPFRSPKSAKLYQKIWTQEGSPLRVITCQQAAKLQNYFGSKIKVVVGMRYGNPSLKSALLEFDKAKINKILIFPLYPQYSSPSTGTVFDKVNEIIRSYRVHPEIRTIKDYYEDSSYIQAVANTLKNNTSQKILFSFHGLPQKFVDKGDVYFKQCHETVRKVTQILNLSEEKYGISFQSRLGRAPWLKPYTDLLLKQWAEEGVESVSVICPGFSADCLETLEEVNMQNRKIFLDAGGKNFNYISALNASDEHINVLAKLIEKNIQGWAND
ncbi:MAG TPA: ferrochelatase [Gammaproteobacteria bacterium]|nr:ferrochelatase [Gammaproteobacteria bacterium]